MLVELLLTYFAVSVHFYPFMVLSVLLDHHYAHSVSLSLSVWNFEISYVRVGSRMPFSHRRAILKSGEKSLI